MTIRTNNVGGYMTDILLEKNFIDGYDLTMDLDEYDDVYHRLDSVEIDGETYDLADFGLNPSEFESGNPEHEELAVKLIKARLNN